MVWGGLMTVWGGLMAIWRWFSGSLGWFGVFQWTDWVRWITVKTSPSQNVPELVKTSPKIGQNVPMVKNVGQNVPKMNFYSIFYHFFCAKSGIFE